MTFEQALKIMPLELYAGIDLVGQHKNISDLHWMAQHELDLHDEGDIELSTKDYRAISIFKVKMKKEMDRAQQTNR